MADEQQGPGRFSDPEERARKQARVRGMTDPLGSMGFRETPQRYQREARARRRVFGGAAASFVIGTALIIAANERGAESAPTTPVVATSSTTGQTVPSQGTSPSQAGATNITQSNGSVPGSNQSGTGTGAGATDDDSSSSGLRGEATDLLTKSRPPLVSIGNNGDDDDRYDDDHDDDDDDEHEDHEGDHEDDDDNDDDEHGSSSVVQNQSNSGSSTTSGANGQNEIVINQSQPHTQTGSTGD